MNDFSARLKKAIENKGASLDEIAKSTGISQETLGNMLSEKIKETNTNRIKTLASYLQVNDDWLITGKGNMTGPDPAGKDGLKSEITVNCDDKVLSKFAAAIESIAKSNSTMSETNKILAENNAELIQQIRNLLHSLYNSQEDYTVKKQKNLQASDKKSTFKP